MRSSTPFVLLLCAIFATVSGWSKEDHEIFRLHDEVQANEGPEITFYEFIGVKPSASQDDLNKAYRKKSRQLHPDKARQNYITNYPRDNAKKQKKNKAGVRVSNGPSDREINAFMKQASERFARLGVVANILRGPDRDRYDHFLKNGFPRWRGTGYYYARFRPGLGSVLFGLFAFGGGVMHYVALYFGWKQRREFAERYCRNARRMAWGDESGIQGISGVGNGSRGTSPGAQGYETPEEGGPTNRRQKRMQEKEARKANAKAAKIAKTSGISTPVDGHPLNGPQGAKKRVVAENGKVLIVDSAGNVFLEEETEEGDTQEFLIDPSEVPPPTFRDTFLFRFPILAWQRSTGRLLGTKAETSDDVANGNISGDEEPTVSALKSATAINANADARRRKAKGHAQSK